MRRYRLGSHARYDLKVHLVWVPNYRKRVLTGAAAIRVRDLLRQVAAENDLHIISGNVAADHVRSPAARRRSGRRGRGPAAGRVGALPAARLE
jgi:hypothetical protein